MMNARNYNCIFLFNFFNGSKVNVVPLNVEEAFDSSR